MGYLEPNTPALSGAELRAALQDAWDKADAVHLAFAELETIIRARGLYDNDPEGKLFAAAELVSEKSLKASVAVSRIRGSVRE
ncbi:hypothetical protein ACUSIJ_28935 [Pseudochelatococcus sp. B33]